MNEKQNEHFSGNENQNQQYEIEVTIKPSMPKNNTTQNERPKETPNISHSNMAGNLKMNQNLSQSNNSQLYAQKKDTQTINLQSKVNIPTNLSSNPKPQENASRTNLKPSLLSPLMISLYNQLREANKLKNPNQKTPNLLQQVINTLKPQVSSEIQQQSANNLKKPAQPPLNIQQTKPIQLPHPESVQSTQTPTQQTFPQANLYKQNLKITGYRMNQNQLEYEYLSTQAPNSNTSYCPSTQFTEFEPIRQFWLHHNGYDEKNPRHPISSPKKKKRMASSYIDYSSDSDSNSPPRKYKSSRKLNDSETSLKIAESDMPPLLSYDKEPKVHIFGVVQKQPVIKIAVQFEKSQTLTVISAAEARKKFPMQLSKFYEQFVTFIDYE